MRAFRERTEKGGRRFERGATMVEYVLIVSLVALGGLVTVRFLTDQGSAEVADQADCVSTRPPPPSCIRPIVSTTTTVVAPTTSTTEAPTTTTTAAPTTTTTAAPATSTTTSPAPTTTTAAPRFSGSASWRGAGQAYESGNGGRWYARAELRIRDDRDQNVRNAVVVVRWTIIDPVNGGTGTSECTTGGDGRCEVRVPSGNSSFTGGIGTIRLEIITINGLAAPVGTPTQDIHGP